MLFRSRTWTYVAQRKNWVDDESHWRDETRAVEDRLYVDGDAFTERLEAQKQLKQERQQEIEDRLKARFVRKDAAMRKKLDEMAQ